MQINFDASTVAPATGEGGSFLPVSDKEKGHLVIISDVPNEMTANKAGNGFFLPITVKIVDGPLSGTEGVMRLNLQHEKPDVMAAAWAEVSALIHVIFGGPRRVGNMKELMNKPFRVISEQQMDAQGQPTQYTQLARGGIRDANGHKAGQSGTGPGTAGPGAQMAGPGHQMAGPGNGQGGNPAQGPQGSVGGQQGFGNGQQGGFGQQGGGAPDWTGQSGGQAAQGGQQPQGGYQIEQSPQGGFGGQPQGGQAAQGGQQGFGGQPQGGAPDWSQAGQSGAPGWTGQG